VIGDDPLVAEDDEPVEPGQESMVARDRDHGAVELCESGLEPGPTDPDARTAKVTAIAATFDSTEIRAELRGWMPFHSVETPEHG
jgi:hypothetical protein